MPPKKQSECGESQWNPQAANEKISLGCLKIMDELKIIEQMSAGSIEPRNQNSHANDNQSFASSFTNDQNPNPGEGSIITPEEGGKSVDEVILEYLAEDIDSTSEPEKY